MSNILILEIIQMHSIHYSLLISILSFNDIPDPCKYDSEKDNLRYATNLIVGLSASFHSYSFN